MTEREVVSLKEYIDTRFQEFEKRLQEHYKLTDRAVETAAKALEIRLEQLNEFRTQILQERQTFARKDDVELRFQTLQEKVAVGSGVIMGSKWAVGIIVALLLSVVGFVLNLI